MHVASGQHDYSSSWSEPGRAGRRRDRPARRGSARVRA